MRRFMLLTALLLGISCSTQDSHLSPQHVAELEDDDLEFSELTLNYSTATFSVQVSSDQGDHLVKLAVVVDQGDTTIACTLDRLAGGEKVYEIDFTSGVGDSTLTFTESTKIDEVRIGNYIAGEMVIEQFTQNDSTLEVSYNYGKYTDQEWDEALANYDSLLYEKIPVDMLETLQDFDAFYQRDNTLHDNPEASVLMRTLSSQKLAALIHQGAYTVIGEPITIDPSSTFRFMCGGVSLFGKVKCHFGFLSNVACDFAIVTEVACLLVEALCEFYWSNCSS